MISLCVGEGGTARLQKDGPREGDVTPSLYVVTYVVCGPPWDYVLERECYPLVPGGITYLKGVLPSCSRWNYLLEGSVTLLFEVGLPA